MVRDGKHVTVRDLIDERVKFNHCRDPTAVNDPASSVRMTGMRTVDLLAGRV